MDTKEKMQQAIAELKEGKETGFNTIYAGTYNYVYQRARMLMKNDQEALDVVQEVYLVVFRSINSLEDISKLYGWIGGITYNLAMRAYRKKKEILLDEDKETIFDTIVWEDETLHPEQKVEVEATGRILKDIIETLPELQKVCVMAFYYDGMTVQDIAEKLECSPNTIKSRLNYARKYLKDAIVEKEKKEGYALHATTIPTICMALYLLQSQQSMGQNAAQNIYDKTCQKLSLRPELIQTIQNGGALQETPDQFLNRFGNRTGNTVQNVGNTSGTPDGTGRSNGGGTQRTVGKTAGNTATRAAKTAGLGIKGKVAVGVTVLTVGAGGVFGVSQYQNVQETSQLETQLQQENGEQEDSRQVQQKDSEYEGKENREVQYPLDVTAEFQNKKEEYKLLQKAITSLYVLEEGEYDSAELEDSQKAMMFYSLNESYQFQPIQLLVEEGWMEQKEDGRMYVSAESYQELESAWWETGLEDAKSAGLDTLMESGNQKKDSDGDYPIYEYLEKGDVGTLMSISVMQTKEEEYVIEADLAYRMYSEKWFEDDKSRVVYQITAVKKEDSPFAGVTFSNVKVKKINKSTDEENNSTQQSGAEDQSQLEAEIQDTDLMMPLLLDTSTPSYEVHTETIPGDRTLEYPVISNWNNTEKQTYWNEDLKIKNDSEDGLEGEESYEVMTRSDQLLSIFFQGSFEGAMHPYSYGQAVNINMETGEKLYFAECVNIEECAAELADNNLVPQEALDYFSSSIDQTADKREQIQQLLQISVADPDKGSNRSEWYISDGKLSILFSVNHAAGDYVTVTLP